MTTYKLNKLCGLLLELREYRNRCKFETKFIGYHKSGNNRVTIFESSIETEHLHGSTENFPNKTVTVRTHTCSKYRLLNNKKKSFKIMAGPDETSIIIIEPIIYKNKTCLIPVKLIENLHWDYILHMDDWF